MIDISMIQLDHSDWAAKNFPTSGVDQAFKGVVEEVGELAHALLKEEQGIRLNEDHHEAAKDAVGDIIIYLIHLCNLKGWSLECIIASTWQSVRSRDWTKNKVNGLVNKD